MTGSFTFNTSPDLDGDGLTLDQEIAAGTNPNDPDTDDDGLLDGFEVSNGFDPIDPDEDDNGMTDGQDDADTDGLDNAGEFTAGTDPHVSDTDGDGLFDGEEVQVHNTDPLDSDTDHDGLSDGDELNLQGTDPLDSDTDHDGLSDGDEVNVQGTDPVDDDSDDDGLLDGFEVSNAFDPNDADEDGNGTTDGEDDTDGDGLGNAGEFAAGTDPLDPDTDDDGLPDGEEVTVRGTDPLDSDTDDDGLLDGEEVTQGTDPLDPLDPTPQQRYAVDMRLNPASADPSLLLEPGDSVILDVYLDAEPGLTILSTAVLFDDDGILEYSRSDSTMPSYILYTGGKHATYLIPNQNPPNYWLPTNELGKRQMNMEQPGKRQINIEYLESSLLSASASGEDIWLATLVFGYASDGDGSTQIEHTLDAGGTIVEAFSQNVSAQTAVTGSFAFNTSPGPGGGLPLELSSDCGACSGLSNSVAFDVRNAGLATASNCTITATSDPGGPSEQIFFEEASVDLGVCASGDPTCTYSKQVAMPDHLSALSYGIDVRCDPHEGFPVAGSDSGSCVCPDCFAEITAGTAHRPSEGAQLDFRLGGTGPGVMGIFLELPNGSLVNVLDTAFDDLPLASRQLTIPKDSLPTGAPSLTYGLKIELESGTMCTDSARLRFGRSTHPTPPGAPPGHGGHGGPHQAPTHP